VGCALIQSQLVEVARDYARISHLLAGLEDPQSNMTQNIGLNALRVCDVLLVRARLLDWSRRVVMRASTEKKLIDRLNLLAEKQRDLEACRAEVFQTWVQTRGDLIRDGHEAGDFPVLRDGEHAWLTRKEQLLRDRLVDEPLHRQALVDLNRQRAEDAERLSAG
jgi:hypothetical protein